MLTITRLLIVKKTNINADNTQISDCLKKNAGQHPNQCFLKKCQLYEQETESLLKRNVNAEKK